MNIINSNLSFKAELKDRPITTHIVLHHAKWKKCTVEDIHRIHIQERKWFGIGYHYFISKTGNIYTGRPIEKEGAHCQGCNGYSIGICFEGDYEIEKEMPIEQITAGKELIQSIKKMYEDISVISTHGEMPNQATKCAGKYFPFEKIIDFTTYFSDIEGHWAEDNIIVAQQLGLIKGYPDGTFRPNEHMTRAEVVSLIVKSLGK